MDATSVYWTNYCDGTVVKLAEGMCAIAAGRGRPRSPAECLGMAREAANRGAERWLSSWTGWMKESGM